MPGYLGLLLEELFEESAKTDFKDKFGEKTLQNFDKANHKDLRITVIQLIMVSI